MVEILSIVSSRVFQDDRSVCKCQKILMRSEMVGFMVNLWRYSLNREATAALAEEVVVFWVVLLDFRMGKLEKSMLGERVLLEGGLVRRVLGDLMVSRYS